MLTVPGSLDSLPLEFSLGKRDVETAAVLCLAQHHVVAYVQQQSSQLLPCSLLTFSFSLFLRGGLFGCSLIVACLLPITGLGLGGGSRVLLAAGVGL